jgi:multidrug transporter EmrE-like cation transporter
MNDIVTKIKNWMDNSIVDEVLLLALLIAFIESCAQNTIKTSDHGTFQFILGLLIYMLVGYILHYAYSKFPMSQINVVWSCVSIIVATLLGYWLYDEPINHWIIFSVLFAILAVYCVYKGSN